MILVFNPGSSSIKYKLYQIKSGKLVCVFEDLVNNVKPTEKGFKDAFKLLLNGLNNYVNQVQYIGYRVVCGDNLSDGVFAGKETLEIIKNAKQFAPLHNSAALFCIKSSKNIFIDARHLCYFDSSFFKDLSKEEQAVPIDAEIVKKYKLRRNGYHGISHQYAYDFVKPGKNEKVITIHLGAGCSISAITHGVPIATSMGLTPLEGLIMQKRSGSIDPGLLIYLIEKIGVREVDKMLNHNSGMAGMTGTSGDMLDILYLAGMKIDNKDYLPDKSLKKNINNYKRSTFALDIYCRSVKKYIGAYSATMAGVDRVIFTGKIGAGSAVIRKKILKGLDYLKIKRIDVIKTDEEYAIAKKILKIIKDGK